MSIRVRVQGLKGLGRAFRAAPGIVSKHLDKAIEKNASEMVGSAKALAPVDSGDLRDSIEKVRDGTGWRVQATDEAAPFVEFGTQAQPAQPYFFVAYRSQKARFARRNRRAIRAAIKEAGLPT